MDRLVDDLAGLKHLRRLQLALGKNGLQRLRLDGLLLLENLHWLSLGLDHCELEDTGAESIRVIRSHPRLTQLELVVSYSWIVGDQRSMPSEQHWPDRSRHVGYVRKHAVITIPPIVHGVQYHSQRWSVGLGCHVPDDTSLPVVFGCEGQRDIGTREVVSACVANMPAGDDHPSDLLGVLNKLNIFQRCNT